MARLRKVVLGALVVGVVYGASSKGCLSSKQAPDEKFADRLTDICRIANANVDSPERGVRELGGYLVRHLGDLTGDFGDTIAVIEATRDDAAHDDRARLARKRIGAPLRACSDDLDRFANAVASDEAATALVNRAGERLGRTIDIVLGSHHGGRVDLRTLERDLAQRLDQLGR